MSALAKVTMAGVIAAICAVAVRKHTPELSILLSVGAGALILVYCSGALASIMEFLDELADMGAAAPEVVRPVARVTGIAIVTRLASDFCKDAGESTLASAVELGGSILSLLAVLPLMSAVLELLGVLLQ